MRLRTGPLTAVLAGGALRDVRVAGHRALDAVYAAVRDPEWATVPGEITAFELAQADGGFMVRFTSRHGAGFEWQGRIDGHAGQLVFDFDGEALDDVAANRIGLCLLHPIEVAGRAAVVCTGSGETAGRFPGRISPHQPFLDLTGLRYDLAAGVRVELSFDGERFEMEDHRNWTDAGFKTYSPPLDRPYPVRYRPGDRVRQSVRIAAYVDRAVAAPGWAAPRVSVGAAVRAPLPELGLPMAGAGLRPAHRYVQVRPSTVEGVRGALLALDAALDLALVAPAGSPADRLAAPLARFAGRLARVSVFDDETRSTAPGTAAALRAALRGHGIDVPVGGGTLANFAELNRMRLDPDELDFITYGIDPRVHHDDPDLVMDTLLAQPHTVRDAGVIGAGRPVVVRLAAPGGGDDFTAAWTVGSLAALTGAAVITPTANGPGVGRVLAALAGRAGAPVYAVDAPPREVAALAVGELLLLANLRAVAREVEVAGQPVRLGPYEVVRR